VSGVEAAIHGGEELWFGVDIEVSEQNQNLAIFMAKMDQRRRDLAQWVIT